MEFYISAPSAAAFSDLATPCLVLLYFVKSQGKPAGYNSMVEDEKWAWIKSKMKTIRRYRRSKLINDLMEAVRALSTILILARRLIYCNRGATKESLIQTALMTFRTAVYRSAALRTFLMRSMQIPTAARPGFLAVHVSERFGMIWRGPHFHPGVLPHHRASVRKVKERFLLMDGVYSAWCTSS